MSLSFAILGLISVANGKLFGSATQSPVFLISIGAFVLFSAVILWKGWDFPLPQFIKNWAYNSGNREDQNLYLRAALMGAGLGVVASPCVGPILFVLVAALSSQQLSLGYGFSLFFFYGIGMSSPFLLFSILLRWANKKVQLGPLTPYAKSLSSVLIALTGIYFLYMGAQQTSLWKNQFDSHKAPFEISGLDALNEKSAAIIDFRADWCAACLELEHKTFYTVEMAALLKEKNMKFIKVDVTRTTPEAEALLNQWKVLSLPQIFIRNSQGKLCIQNTLRNFEKFEDFQKRIETAFLDCR